MDTPRRAFASGVGPLVTIMLGALLALGGCTSASSADNWGRAVEPDIGTSFADFTYSDGNGRVQTLSRHLGDFTVLVFTKCGSGSHASVATPLERLVRDGQDPGIVRTVGFDIHWSESGCRQDGACHLLIASRDTYSICDGKGAVRALYGADARNPVFLIGPNRQIIEKGSTEDWESTQARFYDRIYSYVQREGQERPQEY